MSISPRQCLIWLWVLGAIMPAVSSAEITFFQGPGEQKPPIPKNDQGTRSKMAKVLFFIAPGCSSCPDEAAKLERELNRIGLKYQIEGVFVGDPPQVGKYLAGIRAYPFRFELALDMDGRLAIRHGIKSFPSTVVAVDGKKFVITKVTELEAKLR